MTMAQLKSDILNMSRQDQIGPLLPAFDTALEPMLGSAFPTEHLLGTIRDNIVSDLTDYRHSHNIKTAVIGMSGGVDSALTAKLLMDAGWTVKALLLPINQDPIETERGIEVCEALQIDHMTVDLSNLFYASVSSLLPTDQDAPTNLIRQGNIRARLRMIALYNYAASLGGLVASTDNFSELMAGFWTLHGDVGDLSPIQSLSKSWEVPMLARMNGIPESVWRAKPTDGLGISDGDEAQLGCSYLEWDIITLSIMSHQHKNVEPLFEYGGPEARSKLHSVRDRILKTAYKRNNPYIVDRRYTDTSSAGSRMNHVTEIEQRIAGIR